MAEPVDVAKKASFDDFGGQQVFPDRVSPTIALAKGKRVLNVGCAGSDALVSSRPVHYRIAEVSSFCLGFDIFEPGIRKFANDGYNVVVANAEKLDLETKDFEVAVLGDVIEHVSNPGLVLDNVNRHLVNGGTIVITTPNPFDITLMLKRLLGFQYTVNSEHVAWFDPVLMSYLMDRSGFGKFEVFWSEKSRFLPLRWLQGRTKRFHGTFGMVGRKIRDA